MQRDLNIQTDTCIHKPSKNMKREQVENKVRTGKKYDDEEAGEIRCLSNFFMV